MFGKTVNKKDRKIGEIFAELYVTIESSSMTPAEEEDAKDLIRKLIRICPDDVDIGFTRAMFYRY